MSGLCETLINEHEVIEKVLDSLEAEAREVASGKSVDLDFFAGAIEFVRKFADGVHHQKEEKVLFPALCDSGMPRDGGPVGVMLYEHDEGRGHIRAMESSLPAAGAGDAEARKRLVHESLSYVELLRAHIQKENMILFPMAERVLSPDQHETVRAGFVIAETEAREQSALQRSWADGLSK